MRPTKPIALLVMCFTLLAIGWRDTGAQTANRPGDKPSARPDKPRIAPLPEAQWTDVHRGLAAKYSRADNGFRTLLNVPQIVDSIMPFTGYLSDESTLIPRHRELLILRGVWLSRNDPLWAIHAARAGKSGMTAEEIRRIAEGPDAPQWDPFERTLLRLTDELYRNSSVTERTWKELTGSYDVHHLMDAVETVNHFIFLSTLYNSFGVLPDSGLTAHLPTDIPYRVVVPDRESSLRVARIAPIEGTDLAVGRTFARHPKLAQARALRAGYVNRLSPLSPRHREMLILRIGWNCQSEYEWAQHVGRVGRARDHGLDPRRIAEGPDAPGWDQFEATVLRAADEIYQDAGISASTWKVLNSRFDAASVMSAVFTAGSYRATSMSLNAYGVQLEPGDERFPTVPSR